MAKTRQNRDACRESPSVIRKKQKFPKVVEKPDKSKSKVKKSKAIKRRCKQEEPVMLLGRKQKTRSSAITDSSTPVFKFSKVVNQTKASKNVNESVKPCASTGDSSKGVDSQNGKTIGSQQLDSVASQSTSVLKKNQNSRKTCRSPARYETFMNSKKLKKLKLAPEPEVEDRKDSTKQREDDNESVKVPELMEELQLTDNPESEEISEAEPLSNRIFKVNGDEVLWLLQSNQSIALRGMYELRVLCGAGEICGYKFLPGGEYQQIYSPNIFCSLPFVTRAVEDTKNSRIHQLKSNLIHNKSMLKTLLAEINDSSCVISIRKMSTKLGESVKTVTPFNRLFDEISSDSEPALASLSVEMCRQTDSVFHASVDYKNVQNEVLVSAANTAQAPIIVFCGGKNVGKSTMSRYLVNSVLNVCDTVAYLDCDVGQSEFTPPGLVSLTLIKEPLLGPPFSHQLEPSCCYFIGGTSPHIDPSYYLTCVQQAFNRYKSMDRRVPLFVNTIGWNSGVGVCIMVEVLKMLKPTHVIQLIGKSLKQNYSFELTPKSVLDAAGWKWQKSPQRDGSNELNYRLLPVKCVTSYGVKGAFQLKPADRRDLAVLMHLSPVLPPGYSVLNLHTVQPFEVKWSSIAVRVMHSAVSNNQIMYSMNGSLVALSSIHKKHLRKSEDETLPLFIKGKLPVCECYGFGIVRGIDFVKKCFLIITAVPLEKLHFVNVLIQGGIAVPDQLILNDDIKKPAPYVDEQSTVRGVKPITSQRNFIPRKKYDRIS